MRKRILLVCMLGLSFWLSVAQSDKIIEIRYGSLFGECEGDCFSESVFRLESMTEINTSDTIIFLKEKKWFDVEKAINIKDFYSLQEVIGCPNCLDGGESWVEIKTLTRTHRVTYEFGETPEILNPLISVLTWQF